MALSDDDDPKGHYAAVVAVILSSGIALALNIITITLLWAVVIDHGSSNSGLGENTTQVLVAWGGGIIGVLGAFVGYAFGRYESEHKR